MKHFDVSDVSEHMEELRPSLILYAYNILGSYEEAKDAVQDVLLKFSQLDQDRIGDKKSYLIRMVVNLSIDEKRRQKKRLKNYPGHWLPEPVATDDPQREVYRKEILSFSLMVLLEKLDPRQRAVFILKEAFDYDHDEIARVLRITAENSRKILSRARNELRSAVPVASPQTQSDALRQYLAVIERGDMRELEHLLHEDVSVISDGGGKAAAFRNIIRGIKSVSALLSGLYRKTYRHVRYSLTWVNHQPAICYYHEEQLITCQILSLREGKFEHFFFIRNPDKLAIPGNSAPKTVTFSRGISS